jgi:hypothetical protein
MLMRNLLNTGVFIYYTVKSFKKLKEQISCKKVDLSSFFSVNSLFKFFNVYFTSNEYGNKLTSKEAFDYCFDVKVSFT